MSNEPGYYVEGKYGVRLESAVLVTQTSTEVDFGGRWLAFERLTQVWINDHILLQF